MIREIVLDPFLGSRTTMKVAKQNERNSVGYETDEKVLPIISKKIGNSKVNMATEVQIIKR